MAEELNSFKKKILLVDDSKSVLAKLQPAIEDLGYDVLACNVSREAMSLIHDTHPDCIIVDYEMPDLTGPDLCSLIKNNPETRHIPTIILTSKEEDEYLILALKKGADDFVTKSANIEILHAKIMSAIKTSDIQRELLEIRRLTTIKTLTVTYNHEINNALAIGHAWVQKLKTEILDNTAGSDSALMEEAEKKYEPYFTKISESLNRIKNVVKEITKSEKLQEEDYLLGRTLFKIKHD